jgi:thiol-disulfide isomerase/thioredoxin
MQKGKLTVFFLIGLFLAGCNPKEHTSLICGQIDGYYNKQLMLFNAESVYINNPYSNPIATVKTDNEGQFCFSISVDDVEFIHLFTSDSLNLIETPIALQAGDSIHVKTSIYNKSRPQFSGKGYQISSLLFLQRKNLERNLRHYGIYELPVDGFVAFCDSLQTVWVNRIDSLSRQVPLVDQAVEIAKADVSLFVSFKRFEFLQKHLAETQGLSAYLKPPSSYYSFKDTLFAFADDYWFLPSYSQAVDGLIEDDYQTQKANQKDGLEDEFLHKLSIIEDEYNGVKQQVALSRLSRNFPNYLHNSNAFTLIEQADSLMQSINSSKTLGQYYTQNSLRVAAIKPGVKAPEITLPNVDGQLVSLSSFKGDVVLIVFWGTWCPPCLSSMPKYIEIQEEFKDSDVTFYFVSLEARKYDIESWAQLVRGKGALADKILNGKPLPGVHVVAGGQFSNPQVKPYAITYAPSYVLIDKEGFVVSPRVQLDENLVEKISELLGS